MNGDERESGGDGGARLDAVWAEFAGPRLARRPDFRFDPDFYANRNPDAAGLAPHERARHFAQIGAAEGRAPTLYEETRRETPGLDTLLTRLARDPRLKEAVAAGTPDALALVFELTALGDPVDKTVADFSVTHYRVVSSDLPNASDIALFLHYMKYGHREGRPALVDLRRNILPGARVFDPARPTVVVATHEFSSTGAPLVALDLAARAAETSNVVVMGLRRAGGALVERFAEHAVMVAITDRPAEEWDFFAPGSPLEHAKVAVLNSVECHPFIKALVAKGLPFHSYVHEFTDYSLPAYKCVITALHAERILFSSETVRRSWDGILTDAGFDQDRDSAIVPQAALVAGSVPAADYHAARRTLSRLMGCDLGDRKVVYGAGQVHWRKGTDIFAMAAAQGRRTNPDTLFVWIGDGLDHEDFHIGVWMEKHLAAGRVNTPDGNLFFLPAGPYYADVCRAADVLFLTSRLDPLPNVVFDAAKYGAATLLFEEASGFDDDAYRAEPLLRRVPFGDLAAAADAIAAIPAKTGADGVFAVRPSLPAETGADGTFAVRPDGGLAGLRSASQHGAAESAGGEGGPVWDRIAAGFASADDDEADDGEAGDGEAGDGEASGHEAEGREDGGGAYDVGILFGPADDPALKARERTAIWRRGRRAVWRDRAEAEATLAASDNWVHRTLRIAPYGEADPARAPAFNLHVHAFYPDDFAADLTRYAALRHAARLVATTDTAEKAALLTAAGEAAGVAVETRIVPNRGRDILPFLSLFDDPAFAGGETRKGGDTHGGDATQGAGDEEIWGHVHLKKSLGLGPNSPGAAWRTFLMDILLGGPDRLSAALLYAALPHVGLVTAFDPFIMGWTGSRRLLPPLQARLDRTHPGHPLPDHPLLFPVGNMFFAKAGTVRAMRGLFPPDSPWPGEPLPGDGTVFHLIERLWPAAAALSGRDCVFIDKPGTRRV